jgi:hypothetical protein
MSAVSVHSKEVVNVPSCNSSRLVNLRNKSTRPCRKQVRDFISRPSVLHSSSESSVPVILTVQIPDIREATAEIANLFG